jgi:hypothetical protein
MVSRTASHSLVHAAVIAAVSLLPATALAVPLPVVFEIDDPEDLTYKEQGTVALHDLHVEEQVPVVLAVIPCGDGTTLQTGGCTNGSFHLQYKDWVAANPALVEINQHGYTHDEELATLPRATQRDYLNRGLQEMMTWGLPRGRPFSFAAPFGSSNADTISVRSLSSKSSASRPT